VATAAGGIPEVLADGVTGFLVQPRDHVTMADKLVVLLKDPALQARMGEAALARARERFTVEKMVAGTSAVYERLAGTRRAAGTGRHAAGG
jgi:glycosyltransferase involved in cell wall biosynthesis